MLLIFRPDHFFFFFGSKYLSRQGELCLSLLLREKKEIKREEISLFLSHFISSLRIQPLHTVYIVLVMGGFFWHCLSFFSSEGRLHLQISDVV